MSFGDHLEELRGRILRSLLVIGVVFVGALFFQSSLMRWVVGPHKGAMQSIAARSTLNQVSLGLEGVERALNSIEARAWQRFAISKSEMNAKFQDRLEELRPTWSEAERPTFELFASVIEEQIVQGEYSRDRLLGSLAKLEETVQSVRKLSLWSRGPDRALELIETVRKTVESGVAGQLDQASPPADLSDPPTQRLAPAAPQVDLAANPFSEVILEVESLEGRLEAILSRESGEIRLHTFSYPEAFFSHLRICFLLAVLVGLPWIAFETWHFISAGLYPKERRALWPFLPMSFLGVVCGGAFAYWVLVPVGLSYLGSYGSPDLLETSFRLKDYIGLLTTLLLGMALVFQLPLLMIFLTKARIVEPSFFRRYRKYSVLAALLIGSFLTPPDVVTQLLMAGPLVVLYESGILLAEFFQAKQGVEKEEVID